MFSVHLQEYAYSKYQERKKYYGLLWNEIEGALKDCTEEEAVLMRFLYGTMPVRDAGEYNFSVFLSYVQHSLWLRRNMVWCRELDEDIFIHHVLYYRINSEDISDCRKFFYKQLKDRIQGISLKEAVIEINYWCGENVVYESTDSRTASPMTMYRCGRGRCGEESTFTVTAYRSIGIPARQVYTPRWAHCDDNHAWVEVYLHGTWHFLGACEPEEVLNKGWFSVPANRAILIHSRTFSDFMGSSSEECIEKEDLLTYYNNTAFYAKTRELTITVRDCNGNPASGALVALEILNMAEYFPAATLVTDELGEVRVRIGLGDVKIRAFMGDTFAEKKVSPQITGMVELVLENSDKKTDWITDDWEQEEFAAPKESPIHNVLETLEQKNRKVKRLRESNLLREQRFAVYYNEELASKYPGEAMMFRIAGENTTEIRNFLTKDENPNRKLLLHSLAVKDYKDLKASILEDHLDCEQGNLTDEIYEKYLLCPRIYLEELTPYRKFIREYFNEEENEVFAQNPDLIWEYIKDTIHYYAEVDYKTICATPIGALRLRQGNPLAQKILFVAICRSLNIPARLNQVLLIPEYLKNGVFTVPEGLLQGEGVKDSLKQNIASLILQVKDERKWSYFQTWTLGKFEGTHFATLNYEGISFKNNRLELTLEPGIYRLITSLRMPSGDQRTLSRVFRLEEGEQKCVEMRLWEIPKEDLLVNYSLEDFQIQDETGKEFRISQLVLERPVVLAFLGVGEEPTEHVLNELLESTAHWKKVGSKMIMVLHDPEELKNITLQRVLSTLPGIELFYDKRGNSEKVAAKMQIDTEKLPVLILLKKDLVGIYACGGYNVGSVELMLNLMED